MSIAPDVQNRVTLRPVTDAKVQAQDNGADQIGRGLQGLGAGIAKVADDVQTIVDIHDTAAVKQVETETMRKVAERKRVLMQLTGVNAKNAGEMFEDELQTIREEGMGALKNDRQKQVFSDSFDRWSLTDNAQVNAYLDKETTTWYIETGANRAQTFVERAVDSTDDPEEFARSEATAVAEIADIGIKMGDDPATIERSVAKTRDGIYLGSAVKIEASKGPIAAEDFINTNAAKISPLEESEYRKRLAPALREAKADNMAADVIRALENGSLGNAIEGAAAAGEVDPVKVEEAAAKNAHPTHGVGGAGKPAAKINDTPLKGAESFLPKGGNYGASRDNGARSHGGLDYAAPAGTPVYPRTNGVVIEVDTEGKTIAGYYVKIKYPDGHTSSMAHLRNVNVKVGEQVTTDTVVGGVGGSGMGGQKRYGYHLHETVRGPDGNTIDPTGYKPDGTVLAEKTPGYVPKYDGDRVNLEGAYALARRMVLEKNPQATETEVNEVYERIDKYAARQDKVRDRRYDDAAEVASQQITELIKSGASLTNPAQQISNYGDLDPRMQQQLESNAATNRQVASNEAIAFAEAQAREAADDNVDTVSLLDHQVNTKPGEFMQVDLTKYKGLIPKNDYERLRKEQSELRVQGVQRPELDPKRSQAVTAVNYVLGTALIDKKKLENPKSLDSQRHAWLTAAVLKGIEIQQKQAGRPLSEKEIQDNVVAPLLRPILTSQSGLFGDDVTKMPWYLAKRGGAKVPDLYNK